ncbi:hypothetical protein D5F01_LYC18762 [Larimichthys crocea]|uniref:Nucleoside diphosphate kinase B n=1 Tax=Larimichthys crocea TaxID=215358 RepID=A0A6G0HW01_LARCR|nr:hypothetical protein D5F01_LYC18762 [Larimichthys crocea]
MNYSSCLESILEKVKPLIPTIDFDSLSFDDGEIVTVYQRPASLSLTVPEDFSFSMDDDEPEELLKPVKPEETRSRSVKLDEEVTTTARCATQHPDADFKAGAYEGGIVDTRLDASVKSDEGFPVLSFARLDQWDLDDVLQNVAGDGLSLQQCGSVVPAKMHEDCDKCRSQGDMMEKLVAFSNSQTSKFEPVRSLNHIRMAAELQRSHKECPTVYIDLRCCDPLIKPPRTSPNISSESKSPAKHNTLQETPPAKKPNLKVHTGSQMEGREVTGMSMLLQKIRKMNINRNKDPNKYREKLSQPVESTCSHELHHQEDKQSSHVRFTRKGQTTTRQSTIKEPKQQSSQQGKQVKQTLQHEQHQEILRQLEIHRPIKSVNQLQPAAEKTDVLFDFEAFQLPSISALPAETGSKGCMLLIVNLSGPGMVGDRANDRRKHLYPAATRSHIYNTLVAWFLSLVGPDPRHNEGEAGAKVPFWVAGLQQLWTEDGLALHVLVVARHCYAARERDKDIHFYKRVYRFLSETSFSLIAHWLPQLKTLLDQQACPSPIHLPSSYLNHFISATSKKKVIDRVFGLSPGFYWQTVETQEHVCKGRETTLDLHTEVSVAVGSKAFFLHPIITHYTLQLILDSGLDVCGLRLLYPPQEFLSNGAGAVPVIKRTDETCQPVLALAVRGPHAHSVLKDLTSTLDPLLPRQTDPNTIHYSTQQPPLLYSPGLATQVHKELCLWFSGRVREGSVQYHNQLNSGRVSGSLSRSPSFLCATTKADLLLVVSPVVPPYCYSQILAVCERRGLSLMGLQRLQLQTNGTKVLGLNKQQAPVFCSPYTVTLDQEERELHSHCLVLLLRKENAIHHSVSLPAALMREFMAQNLLGCIHSRIDGVHTVDPSFCFHTVPYSSNLFHIFVRSMWSLPDPSSVILSRQKRSSNSNMEQVVVLTLCGKDMSHGLSLLHRVLTEEAEGDGQHARLKLLGLKYLPALSRFQAQELSPYEVGEQLYLDSLENLMSSPALVCALRQVEASASLRKLLPHNYPSNVSALMSPTLEAAFRQASLFFFEHEMTPDDTILQLLPQTCSIKDPQMRLTVCLFKPRIWNHDLAEIVRKLELSGLTLVGLRVVTMNKNNATSLLPADSDLSDLKAHVEYLCSGSSLVLCLEGENAVKRLLEVLEQVDSFLPTTSRGMGHSYKGSYGSPSNQKAIQDVKRLFPELCCTVRQEQVINMCSDPLATEGLLPLMATRPNEVPGSLIRSALWQTTCLLIPLNAPPLNQVPSQLDMLEQLLRSGCHLVAGRMSVLDNEQKKHIAEMLSSRGNEMMVHLSTSPCFIVAVQGEMIVTHFDLILRRIYKERSDLKKLGEMIIYPKYEKEAKQLIRYLFDAFSPERCHTIVP